MRFNRREKKMSRLADREDLRGMFYAIPWIERGKVFRFMKRQRWTVGLTILGMAAVANATGNYAFIAPPAFRLFVEQLLKGKTFAQIGAEIRLPRNLERRWNLRDSKRATR